MSNLWLRNVFASEKRWLYILFGKKSFLQIFSHLSEKLDRKVNISVIKAIRQLKSQRLLKLGAGFYSFYPA
ncbi:MAG: hypothetical protein AMJ91_07000 [candidate division Zixibacteria bacterium SM23_73_3]|nr:MAG: hypothetical protein AMJ91_07000 [candidate division Zixibacteria bacterium SM23_73_3]